ncbi:hypothetical protein GCM10009722_04790 [Williamsia deligens]
MNRVLVVPWSIAPTYLATRPLPSRLSGTILPCRGRAAWDDRRVRSENDDIVDLLDHAFRRLVDRMGGLTDDE